MSNLIAQLELIEVQLNHFSITQDASINELHLNVSELTLYIDDVSDHLHNLSLLYDRQNGEFDVIQANLSEFSLQFDRFVDRVSNISALQNTYEDSNMFNFNMSNLILQLQHIEIRLNNLSTLIQDDYREEIQGNLRTLSEQVSQLESTVDNQLSIIQEEAQRSLDQLLRVQQDIVDISDRIGQLEQLVNELHPQPSTTKPSAAASSPYISELLLTITAFSLLI